MIIGIGSDLIDIRRVEKSLERFGERFTNRCFTEVERAKSDRRANPRRILCQALCGQGSLLQGARDRHGAGRVLEAYGVVNLLSGKPTMKLTGGAGRDAAVDAAGRPPGRHSFDDNTMITPWLRPSSS